MLEAGVLRGCWVPGAPGIGGAGVGFGQHQTAPCPVGACDGRSGLAGLANLCPAGQPKDLHSLCLKARRPGKLHRLAGFQLAERFGPGRPRQRTLCQSVQPAKTRARGGTGFGQNGNAPGRAG